MTYTESIDQMVSIVETAFGQMDVTVLQHNGNLLLAGLSVAVLAWSGIQIMFRAKGSHQMMAMLLSVILHIGIAYFLLNAGFKIVVVNGIDDSLTQVANIILPGSGTLHGAVQAVMELIAHQYVAIAKSMNDLTKDASALDVITIIGKNLLIIGTLLTTQLLLTVSLIIYFVMGIFSVFMIKIALILGPIFIPWMIYERTSFLFDGWLRFLISSSLYKVVGAVVLMFGGKILTAGTALVTNSAELEFPSNVIGAQLLAFLSIAVAFLTLKIPAIANGLISGASPITFPKFP